MERNSIRVENISTDRKKEIDFLREIHKENFSSTVFSFIDTESIIEETGMGHLHSIHFILSILIYELYRLIIKNEDFNSFFIQPDKIGYYNQVNIGCEFNLKKIKIIENQLKDIKSIESQLTKLKDNNSDNCEFEELPEITFSLRYLTGEDVYLYSPQIGKDHTAYLTILSFNPVFKSIVATLTFDQRVINSQIAANFLSELKKRIELYSDKEKLKKQKVNSVSCYKCLLKLSQSNENVTFFNVVDTKGEQKYLCHICYEQY